LAGSIERLGFAKGGYLAVKATMVMEEGLADPWETSAVVSGISTCRTPPLPTVLCRTAMPPSTRTTVSLSFLLPTLSRTDSHYAGLFQRHPCFAYRLNGTC